jgi:hypothetical protein
MSVLYHRRTKEQAPCTYFFRILVVPEKSKANHAMQRTREPPSGCSFVNGRGPLIASVMRLNFFAQVRNSAAALMPSRPMAALVREPDRQCAHHHDECRHSQNDNRCFAHCSLCDSPQIASVSQPMPARDHRSKFCHSATASQPLFATAVPARDIVWRSLAADGSRRVPQTAGSTDTLPPAIQRWPVPTVSNSYP